MKLADVIDELRRRGLNNGGSLGKHTGIYDMAADLLEKHIPKKVKPITRTIQKVKHGVCPYKQEKCEHLKEIDGCFEYTDYVCPTCGALVADNGTPQYCWRCGQEFVWEKEVLYLMKSVLLSIKPKYCELITNGRKTVEIRKTRPKIDTPFRCYIYCTKETELWVAVKNGQALERGDGKVIGEFVCDNIREYQTEFYTGDIFYQAIYQYADDNRYILEPVATNEGFDKGLLKKSALSFEEIKNYIGMEDETFYAWHISDLVIYDTPRELKEFKKVNRDCVFFDLRFKKANCFKCKHEDCFLKRPPQSWCYVEEVS